jgi:FKBP-type peptidyl-prolyl cis-trans isomerase
LEDIMKKYAFPLVLLSAALLQACGQEGSAPAPATATAPAATSESALDDTESRLSYGIAYNFGMGMAQEKFPLDKDAFNVGLADALAGKESRVTREELTAEMESYQKQLAGDKLADESTYLQQSAASEGVTTTASGLQYVVVTAGEGVLPATTDTVRVHYRGTLTDGTEFDSSYSRNQPAEFRLDQVIPGWTEALQLMKVGSKWNLTIPSALAYGQAGAPPTIRPYSTLLFEVELLAIVSPEAAAEAPAEAPAAPEG